MIGFVVLHYLAEEMTVQCTEALLGLSGDKHIVLVDNASPNGSGQRLAARYEDNPAVSVLLSPRNGGFARGNNMGYTYLRGHFSSDFIVVLNNDVLIRDKDFPAKVQTLFEKTPFAVLGPDILNPQTREHQNPARLNGFTRQEVEERVARYQKNLRHFGWNRFKWKLKQRFRPAPPQLPRPSWQKAVENAGLLCVLTGFHRQTSFVLQPGHLSVFRGRDPALRMPAGRPETPLRPCRPGTAPGGRGHQPGFPQRLAERENETAGNPALHAGAA